tara:strand:- start:123165 stop:123293 length:129 start_codon:yes stop_codon:yes gene_type:complete
VSAPTYFIPREVMLNIVHTVGASCNSPTTPLDPMPCSNALYF